MRIFADVWGLDIQPIEIELTLADQTPEMEALRPMAADNVRRALAEATRLGAALGERQQVVAQEREARGLEQALERVAGRVDRVLVLEQAGLAIEEVSPQYRLRTAPSPVDRRLRFLDRTKNVGAFFARIQSVPSGPMSGR